jgi:mannose-1-phosphate guanylyltransferase/phosphomannomutase
LTDGLKVFDDRGWAQLLPDPDEPLLHIYAEGGTDERSVELESELRSLVEDIMRQQESETEAPISS